MSTKRAAMLMHLCAVLVFVASVATGQTVPAYDPSVLTRAQRDLTSLVARLGFNEALSSYPDLALVWQVTEGHGSTDAERLNWLAGHSRCVSGWRGFTQEMAEQRPGNCRWARNLNPQGVLPRGWPYSSEHWRHRTRARWLQTVASTVAFVTGEDTYRPCAETPTSWDGVRYGLACVERGEDCPAVARQSPRNNRVLECDVPYTSDVTEEGLHLYAVVRGSRDGA